MNNIDPSAYISFGSRIRKSPFYNSTRKYGAKAFTIYNHMSVSYTHLRAHET